MIEYISLNDLAGTYNQLTQVYQGEFLNNLEFTKQRARSDIYTLLQNSGKNLESLLNKKNIELDQVISMTSLRLLIDKEDFETSFEIEYFDERKTLLEKVEIFLTEESLKENILLSPYPYFKIISDDNLKFFTCNNIIFEMFYYQILYLIAESGALSNEETMDIWFKRGQDLLSKINTLANSVVSLENGENIHLRDCRFVR